jgi:dTMP kinase
MFITLEGIEGSGKTSQLENIADFFKRNGYRCETSREPGGTRTGEKIRTMLLDPESKDMDPVCEMLLYMADRAQHLKTVVWPALSVGKVVVCDRFVDATVVYQGWCRGIGMKRIQEFHKTIFNDFKPDLTFLLDVSPETGLSRAWKQIRSGNRQGEETRFERETLDFHRKVREGYLLLARQEPNRFHIIDAGKLENEVFQDIRQVLSALLKNPNHPQPNRLEYSTPER